MAGRDYLDAITVNGVNVLSYLNNYKIKSTKNYDDITKGTVRLMLNVSDVLILESGQEVIISRGLITTTDNYILRGYVEKFQEEDGMFLVSVIGRLENYNHDYFTYSYDKDIDSEAGNPSKIWADIVQDGGLTASYVDSGTDIILDKFISNDNYRFERMGKLIKLLGYQMYDDYDNNYVRAEPIGYTTYATTLTVGSNIVNIPIWDEDLTQVRNRIKIKGSYEEDTKTETFTGTGSQYDFYITNEPEITKVTVNGVEQVRGIVGSSTTYDYTVDKQLKKFSFTVAPTLSHAVVIQYTYRKPKPVEGTNYTSINYYQKKIGEVFTLTDVMTVADATVRLNKLLDILGFAFVKTEIITLNTVGLKAGMLVTVVDVLKPKYNNSYIVNEITYQYPEPFDICQIGSTDFNINNLLQTINERLQELEQENQLNTGELTSLIQLVDVTQIERRYFKREKATIDADILYLDHPTQGTWDDFDWGEDTEESKTTIALMPGNGKFKEYVTDTAFYDSGNSTDITWTTATNTILIGATTGVLVTNAISIGIPYSQYKVIFHNPSASGLTVEISCDGKSTWESVYLNTTTDFISTTTDVYLRVSNTTGSAITLTPTTDLGNQLIDAAIEVQLE